MYKLVFFLYLCSLATAAQEYYWKSCHDGSWSAAKNWEGKKVPCADCSVVFAPCHYQYSVVITESVTVSSLTTHSGLLLSAPPDVSLKAAHSFFANGGSSVVFSNTSSVGSTITGSADVTLSQSSRLYMSGNWELSGITSLSPYSSLVFTDSSTCSSLRTSPLVQHSLVQFSPEATFDLTTLTIPLDGGEVDIPDFDTDYPDHPSAEVFSSPLISEDFFSDYEVVLNGDVVWTDGSITAEYLTVLGSLYINTTKVVVLNTPLKVEGKLVLFNNARIETKFDIIVSNSTFIHGSTLVSSIASPVSKLTTRLILPQDSVLSTNLKQDFLTDSVVKGQIKKIMTPLTTGPLTSTSTVTGTTTWSSVSASTVNVNNGGHLTITGSFSTTTNLNINHGSVRITTGGTINLGNIDIVDGYLQLDGSGYINCESVSLTRGRIIGRTWTAVSGNLQMHASDILLPQFSTSGSDSFLTIFNFLRHNSKITNYGTMLIGRKGTIPGTFHLPYLYLETGVVLENRGTMRIQDTIEIVSYNLKSGNFPMINAHSGTLTKQRSNSNAATTNVRLLFESQSESTVTVHDNNNLRLMYNNTRSNRHGVRGNLNLRHNAKLLLWEDYLHCRSGSNIVSSGSNPGIIELESSQSVLEIDGDSLMNPHYEQSYSSTIFNEPGKFLLDSIRSKNDVQYHFHQDQSTTVSELDFLHLTDTSEITFYHIKQDVHWEKVLQLDDSILRILKTDGDLKIDEFIQEDGTTEIGDVGGDLIIDDLEVGGDFTVDEVDGDVDLGNVVIDKDGDLDIGKVDGDLTIDDLVVGGDISIGDVDGDVDIGKVVIEDGGTVDLPHSGGSVDIRDDFEIGEDQDVHFPDINDDFTVDGVINCNGGTLKLDSIGGNFNVDKMNIQDCDVEIGDVGGDFEVPLGIIADCKGGVFKINSIGGNMNAKYLDLENCKFEVGEVSGDVSIPGIVSAVQNSKVVFGNNMQVTTIGGEVTLSNSDFDISGGTMNFDSKVHVYSSSEFKISACQQDVFIHDFELNSGSSGSAQFSNIDGTLTLRNTDIRSGSFDINNVNTLTIPSSRTFRNRGGSASLSVGTFNLNSATFTQTSGTTTISNGQINTNSATLFSVSGGTCSLQCPSSPRHLDSATVSGGRLNFCNNNAYTVRKLEWIGGSIYANDLTVEEPFSLDDVSLSIHSNSKLTFLEPLSIVGSSSMDIGDSAQIISKKDFTVSSPFTVTSSGHGSSSRRSSLNVHGFTNINANTDLQLKLITQKNLTLSAVSLFATEFDLGSHVKLEDDASIDSDHTIVVKQSKWISGYGSLLHKTHIYGEIYPHDKLEVEADLVLQSTATLHAYIYDASSIARVYSTGHVTLGGTLDVSFTMQPIGRNDGFAVLKYSSFSGNFANTNFKCATFLDHEYHSDELIITISSPIIPDLQKVSYIQHIGTDNRCCGTVERPCQTFGRIKERMGEKGTVWVLPGEFTSATLPYEFYNVEWDVKRANNTVKFPCPSSDAPLLSVTDSDMTFTGINLLSCSVASLRITGSTIDFEDFVVEQSNNNGHVEVIDSNIKFTNSKFTELEGKVFDISDNSKVEILASDFVSLKSPTTSAIVNKDTSELILSDSNLYDSCVKSFISSKNSESIVTNMNSYNFNGYNGGLFDSFDSKITITNLETIHQSSSSPNPVSCSIESPIFKLRSTPSFDLSNSKVSGFRSSTFDSKDSEVTISNVEVFDSNTNGHLFFEFSTVDFVDSTFHNLTGSTFNIKDNSLVSFSNSQFISLSTTSNGAFVVEGDSKVTLSDTKLTDSCTQSFIQPDNSVIDINNFESIHFSGYNGGLIDGSESNIIITNLKTLHQSSSTSNPVSCSITSSLFKLNDCPTVNITNSKVSGFKSKTFDTVNSKIQVSDFEVFDSSVDGHLSFDSSSVVTFDRSVFSNLTGTVSEIGDDSTVSFSDVDFNLISNDHVISSSDSEVTFTTVKIQESCLESIFKTSKSTITVNNFDITHSFGYSGGILDDNDSDQLSFSNVNINHISASLGRVIDCSISRPLFRLQGSTLDLEDNHYSSFSSKSMVATDSDIDASNVNFKDASVSPHFKFTNSKFTHTNSKMSNLTGQLFEVKQDSEVLLQDVNIKDSSYSNSMTAVTSSEFSIVNSFIESSDYNNLIKADESTLTISHLHAEKTTITESAFKLVKTNIEDYSFTVDDEVKAQFMFDLRESYVEIKNSVIKPQVTYTESVIVADYSTVDLTNFEVQDSPVCSLTEPLFVLENNSIFNIDNVVIAACETKTFLALDSKVSGSDLTLKDSKVEGHFDFVRSDLTGNSFNFVDLKGQVLILDDNSKLNANDLKINSCKTDHKPLFSVTQKSDLVCSGLKLSDSTSTSYSIISIDNSELTLTTVDLSDTKFSNIIDSKTSTITITDFDIVHHESNTGSFINADDSTLDFTNVKTLGPVDSDGKVISGCANDEPLITLVKSNVDFDDVVVVGCQSQSIVATDSTIDLETVLVRDSTATDGHFELTKTSLTMNNANFQSLEGKIFNIKDNTEVTGTNVGISDSDSTTDSIILIDDSELTLTTVDLSDTKFSNIIDSKTSTITITDFDIVHHESNTGSFINADDSTLDFTNVKTLGPVDSDGKVISGCANDEPLITLVKSNVDFDDVVVVGCQSQSIVATDSTIDLETVLVRDSTATDGHFELTKTTLTMNNANFQGLEGKVFNIKDNTKVTGTNVGISDSDSTTDSIILIDDSELSLTTVDFSDTKFSNIIDSKTSTITITDFDIVHHESNTGSFINADDSTLDFTNVETLGPVDSDGKVISGCANDEPLITLVKSNVDFDDVVVVGCQSQSIVATDSTIDLETVLVRDSTATDGHFELTKTSLNMNNANFQGLEGKVFNIKDNTKVTGTNVGISDSDSTTDSIILIDDSELTLTTVDLSDTKFSNIIDSKTSTITITDFDIVHHESDTGSFINADDSTLDFNNVKTLGPVDSDGKVISGCANDEPLITLVKSNVDFDDVVVVGCQSQSIVATDSTIDLETVLVRDSTATDGHFELTNTNLTMNNANFEGLEGKVFNIKDNTKVTGTNLEFVSIDAINEFIISVSNNSTATLTRIHYNNVQAIYLLYSTNSSTFVNHITVYSSQFSGATFDFVDSTVIIDHYAVDYDYQSKHLITSLDSAVTVNNTVIAPQRSYLNSLIISTNSNIYLDKIVTSSIFNYSSVVKVVEWRHQYPLIFSTNSNYEVTHSTITNSGAKAVVSSNSNFKFNNVIFTNSSTDVHLDLIHSTLDFSHVLVCNNSRGILASLRSDSDFTSFNFTLRDSKQSDYFIFVDSSKISLDDTFIINSKSPRLLNTLGSEVLINDLFINDSEFSHTTHYFVSSKASLNLKNVEYNYIAGHYVESYHSDLQISDFSINENVVFIEAMVKSVSSTYKLTKMSTSNYDSPLFSSFKSDLIFTLCSFDKITLTHHHSSFEFFGSNLIFDQVSVSNSRVESTDILPIVYCSQSKLLMKDSNVNNNFGVMFYSNKDSIFVLENSLFESNESPLSPIILEEVSLGLIHRMNVFRNNRGYEGGCASVLNSVNFTCQSNLFSGSFANRDGGSLNVRSSRSISTARIVDNSFVGSHAFRAGGAIYLNYRPYPKEEDLSNNFQDCQAYDWGNDIATDPRHIELEWVDPESIAYRRDLSVHVTDYYHVRAWVRSEYVDQLNLYPISGDVLLQGPPTTRQVSNWMLRTVITMRGIPGNYTLFVGLPGLEPAEITFYTGSCPLGHGISGPQCVPCREGTRSSPNGNSTCINCPAGQWSHQGSYDCYPCPIGSFRPDDRSPACQACPVGSIAPEVGSKECKLCGYRQVNDHGRSECECISSYLAGSDSEGNLDCLPCPLGLTCFGSDATCVMPGYWSDISDLRSENSTGSNGGSNFYKCQHAGCLGSCVDGFMPEASDLSSSDLCDEYHTGPLCLECIDHSYMMAGRCVTCGGFIQESTTLGVSTVAYFIFVYAIVTQGARIGMFLNVFRFLQMILSTIIMSNITIHSYLLPIYGVLKSIFLDIWKTVPLMCLDLLPRSYSTTLIGSIGVLLATVLFVKIVKPKDPDTGYSSRQYTAEVLYVFLLLFLPSLIHLAFGLFSCLSVDGQFIVEADASENILKCYTLDWYMLVGIVALAFIVFSWLLVKFNTTRCDQEATFKNTLDVSGLFGYRKMSYEKMFLLSTSAITGILWLFPSGMVRLAASIIVTLGSIALICKCAPYKDNKLNYASVVSFGVLLIVIFFSFSIELSRFSRHFVWETDTFGSFSIGLLPLLWTLVLIGASIRGFTTAPVTSLQQGKFVYVTNPLNNPMLKSTLSVGRLNC
ncbi:hypothetical protein P9112_003954 [Eukaryota sp. TZLM1-RC]